MKNLYILIFLCIIDDKIFAQSWNLNGNSGTTATNFLGTTDNKPIIFKTKNKERSRIDVNGTWRMGSATNYARIDSSGKLSFGGTGAYRVAGNSYVFQYAAVPNYGLFFNSTNTTYEFRNGNAVPVFYVNASNGNGVFTGNLTIGGYTLPATDGAAGEVLTTNGAGTVSWSAVVGGGGANLSLSNLSATAVNQSLVPNTNNTLDVGSNANSWRDLYLDGSIYLDDAKFISNTGTASTYTGFQAGTFSSTGSFNSGFGHQALYTNTSGENNTGFGYQALYTNAQGYSNTAAGAKALYSNTNGEKNSAFGHLALYLNTGGYNNTASGYQALYNTNSGNSNTAAGHRSLYFNTSGSSNTAVGSGALYSNNTGTGNTAVGSGAETNNGNHSFSTAIGRNALITASSQVRIGSNEITSIGGYANWTNISDGRVKKNIRQNVPGLAFINKLKPVTYNLDLGATESLAPTIAVNNEGNRTTQPSSEEIAARNAKEQVVYSGFVAQDVEKVAKTLNYTFSGVDAPKNDKDLYGLRYAEFVVPLVKAVQELSSQNDALRSMINDLKAELQQLKKELASGKPANAKSKVINNALLGQNIPNSFSNTTAISYTLPENYKAARVVVTGKDGRPLKEINIAGVDKGTVHVDAAALASGTYNYALVVDGKTIHAKQMILIK